VTHYASPGVIWTPAQSHISLQSVTVLRYGRSKYPGKFIRDNVVALLLRLFVFFVLQPITAALPGGVTITTESIVQTVQQLTLYCMN